MAINLPAETLVTFPSEDHDASKNLGLDVSGINAALQFFYNALEVGVEAITKAMVALTLSCAKEDEGGGRPSFCSNSVLYGIPISAVHGQDQPDAHT